nr:uncharacterized protein LOC120966570 [Aegilops tauschii subsp. strangulata]
MFSFGIPSPCHCQHTPSRPQSNAMAAASFLFLTILAAAITTAYSVDSTREISNGSCIPAERAALLSFKAGITRDPVNRLVSWQQRHHDCCRWSGVTCSRRTGHVVKLDVRYDDPIPTSYDFLGFDGYPRYVDRYLLRCLLSNISSISRFEREYCSWRCNGYAGILGLSPEFDLFKPLQYGFSW